ncbi:Zinc finger, C3HC4 type (RING finger) containing protein [Novymonas esmeraldas]|uniref:Zinc finger, C3HC4 type (RING finger) containing protein n=1 Tax=Novymonas esmeraldas TaxID=1808958 RepID=A0AAW0EXQ7_9TRYP
MVNVNARAGAHTTSSTPVDEDDPYDHLGRRRLTRSGARRRYGVIGSIVEAVFTVAFTVITVAYALVILGVIVILKVIFRCQRWSAANRASRRAAALTSMAHMHRWKTLESETEEEARREEQRCWYRLPPRGTAVAAAAAVDAMEPIEDCVEATIGGTRCVCCLEHTPTHMFLACLHTCLCEPCLIHMGRTYEDTKLHGKFVGPVRLPCPLCREIGPVVKRLCD